MSLDHRIAPINFQRNTIHTLWFQRNFTGKLTSNLMTLFFSFLCVWLRQSSSLATAELEISARTSSSYSDFSWFGTINKDHTPLHSWVSSMPHPTTLPTEILCFSFLCITYAFLSYSYIFPVPMFFNPAFQRSSKFLERDKKVSFRVLRTTRLRVGGRWRLLFVSPLFALYIYDKGW